VGHLPHVHKAHGPGIGLEVVHEAEQLIERRRVLRVALELAQVARHGVVIFQRLGHEQLPVLLVA
jgi:hypothetical protein